MGPERVVSSEIRRGPTLTSSLGLHAGVAQSGRSSVVPKMTLLSWAKSTDWILRYALVSLIETSDPERRFRALPRPMLVHPAGPYSRGAGIAIQ